eukprot:m.57498 g.57498  ORF g.57498 m.57498 type:complete len:422 (+) comp11113_c0_seq1:1519-2784(+)
MSLRQVCKRMMGFPSRALISTRNFSTAVHVRQGMIPIPKVVKESDIDVAPVLRSLNRGEIESIRVAGVSTREDNDVKPWQSSWMEVTIPLSHDMLVRDRYHAPHKGTVRYGRLLELLDAFTGDIAAKHVDISEYDGSRTVVTVSVDSFTSLGSISSTKDLIARGCVSWVGRSSMEITAELHQDGQCLSTSRFYFVARNLIKKESAVVSKLSYKETDAPDVSLFSTADNRCAMRKQNAMISLDLVPPTQDESALIYELHKKKQNSKFARDRTVNVVTPQTLEESIIRSVYIMQMDNRNLHGNIFGGFLMRISFEAAFASAVLLMKCSFADVSLKRISEFHFSKPVHVGDLIEVVSRPVFSEGKSLIVNVHVGVKDPQTKNFKHTNKLVIEFYNRNSDCPAVIPDSLEEYLSWLDGRRIYLSP